VVLFYSSVTFGELIVDVFSFQMKKTPPLYDDVLGYLAYLPFVAPIEEILALLRTHGRTLAKQRAAVFCTLLIKLCSGDYVSLLPSNHPVTKTALSGPHTPISGGTSAKESAAAAKSGNKDASKEGRNGKGNAVDVLKSFTHLVPADVVIPIERLPIAEVTYLFSADESNLLALLEGFMAGSSGRMLPAKFTMTLVEMYMQRYARMSQQLRELQHGAHSPKQGHHNPKQGQHTPTAPTASSLEASLQSTEGQIMALFDGAHAQYDAAHALLLCHSFGFERGQRYLLERQQCTELLMRLLIEGNDVKEVFKVLRREGSKDPDLYIQVLTYFVEQSIVPEDAQGVEGSKGRKVGNAARRRDSGSDRGSDDESSQSEGDYDVDDEERWVIHVLRGHEGYVVAVRVMATSTGGNCGMLWYLIVDASPHSTFRLSRTLRCNFVTAGGTPSWT
jgi:hypothetical protein